MASLYLVLDLINDLVTGDGHLVAEIERREVLARSAAPQRRCHCQGPCGRGCHRLCARRL